MDTNLIPSPLHHLIPLVEKWGIEDDGYRDELVEDSSVNDLNLLVNSISDNDADALDIWFCDPDMLDSPSQEYIKYSVFFMAYEYAKSVLEDRNTNLS